MQHILNQYLITWTPECDIPGILDHQSVRIIMYVLMDYEILCQRASLLI